MQVIGVGSQEDFASAQEFRREFDLDEVTLLWEWTARVWRINDNSVTSALQLFSFDLSEKSDFFSFDDNGRRIIIDAAGHSPWAP